MLRSLPQLTDLSGAPPAEAPSSEGAVDLASAYRLHAGQVARWAQRLAGPGLDLEDVVHDVFLVAQGRFHQWRGEAKLSTWLYEITIRVVQRRRRTLRRWRWLPFARPGRDGEGDEALARAALPLTPAPTPVDLYERRVASALLYELLDGLSEKHRTAVILFELEGLSGREIAELTRTSLGNVWVRIMRGRTELQRLLAAREKREQRRLEGGR
jgi:RNA polymerase sigma-70 factor (ECF subfamily)